MDITVKQSINVNVYVENTYTGNLPQTSLDLTKSIPWSDWIKTWLNTLSLTAELAPDCELSLRLASDHQIQALNHQYRALTQPTDVLAFAATEAEILIPQDLAEPLY
ncbi:MAG: rRNA maturation RNase YbeY, partial [Cyanobacteria bacterium P01_A01_bin.40]